MNEDLMFERVRELCIETGNAIDDIAKECNINQNLVIRFYLMLMEKVIKDVEKENL